MKKVDNVRDQWALCNSGIEGSVKNADKSVMDIDINAKDMWNLQRRRGNDNEIVIAIIDSEIDFSVEELKSSRWINEEEKPNNNIDDDKNGYVDDTYGWDFVNDKPLPEKVEGKEDVCHGTAIAGIIAGEADNKGITGVAAYTNKKIMPVKILSNTLSDVVGSTEDLIAAIKYAECQGAKICNLSLGTDKYSSDLKKVMEESAMLFVTSSGNCQGPLRRNIDKKPYYPASFKLKNMITVGSIMRTGEISSFCNCGKDTVDIFAPGEDILVINRNNHLSCESGTSLAAPFVTGTAACIISIVDVAPEDTKKIICETATIKGNLTEKCRTGGFLNAYEAIRKALQLLY